MDKNNNIQKNADTKKVNTIKALKMIVEICKEISPQKSELN